jgi:hypothetical protein
MRNKSASVLIIDNGGITGGMDGSGVFVQAVANTRSTKKRSMLQ